MEFTTSELFIFQKAYFMTIYGEARSVPDPDPSPPCHYDALLLPLYSFQRCNMTTHAYFPVFLPGESSSTASPRFQLRLIRHHPLHLDSGDETEENHEQRKPGFFQNEAFRKLP